MLELWYFTWVLLPWVQTFLTRELDLLFKNVNFANNFWTVNVRALILITCVFIVTGPLCGYQHFALLPWPWNLILILLITFEQWELEFWYFPWIFLVISFCGIQDFFTSDLGVWLLFEYFNLANSFYRVSGRVFQIPHEYSFLKDILVGTNVFILWP